MSNYLFLFAILGIMLWTSCEDMEPEPMEVPEPAPYNHKQSVGASANDLLSDTLYRELLVEINYMAGFRLQPETVNNLVDFLSARLNKPAGIQLIETEIPAMQQAAYSLSDIRMLEDTHRNHYTDSTTLAAHFLLLDGDYESTNGNSSVLGIAYYNTSMVLFQKTIAEFSDQFNEPDRDKLETTVVHHEFGHIFGLVNTGSDMQINHQDSQHGHHCDNPDCLMYWTAETGDIVSNLIGSTPIPELDGNCLNDLKANGGK